MELDINIKEKLKKQLEYTIGRSDFYKKKFKDFTINEKDLKGLFYDLPFTTKSELLKDQEEFPPFGSNLCVKIEKLKRIHKTSGTTNKPLIVALTDGDVQNTIRIGAECFNLSGLSKKDIVIHCLNYNMWAGGYTDHQSLETTGACVIPYGVGKTSNLIETILLLKPTAIHCTPSYLSKIELVLKKEYLLKPFNLKLRVGLFGGEGGLQNPDFRKNIEDKWGLIAMNANYGMSDVLSIFGAECKFQKGLHFMAQDVLLTEIIDIKSGKSIPIEEGVEGEQILTNLDKEAQPLIRYRTGDIIKIISSEICECGERGYLFEIKGRTDDMIVVKGINVHINSIERIINEKLDYFTGVYRVLVSKNEPIDQVEIIIEMKKEFYHNIGTTVQSLHNKIQSELFFNPTLKLVEEGSIPRTEGKLKKLLKIL